MTNRQINGIHSNETKFSIDKNRPKKKLSTIIDYGKVKNYWNGVKPTILGPYRMDNLGLPNAAGHIRFTDEAIVIKKLTGAIKSDSSVLDLGSGMGLWTEYFASHYKNVVSVESSKVFYEVLQNRFSTNPRVETVESDALSFKTNKKFGIIFLGGLLMYLNSEDVVILLMKIATWLEPGGVIICRESTSRKGIFTRQIEYNAIYRSPDQYRSIFKRSNLSLEVQELNKAYLRAKMSSQVINKWKKLIPQRFWKLPFIGFMSYWVFRLGYPQNIKFWCINMKKLGIEFPSLHNHYFVLKSN